MSRVSKKLGLEIQHILHLQENCMSQGQRFETTMRAYIEKNKRITAQTSVKEILQLVQSFGKEINSNYATLFYNLHEEIQKIELQLTKIANTCPQNSPQRQWFESKALSLDTLQRILFSINKEILAQARQIEQAISQKGNLRNLSFLDEIMLSIGISPKRKKTDVQEPAIDLTQIIRLQNEFDTKFRNAIELLSHETSPKIPERNIYSGMACVCIGLVAFTSACQEKERQLAEGFWDREAIPRPTTNVMDAVAIHRPATQDYFDMPAQHRPKELQEHHAPETKIADADLPQVNRIPRDQISQVENSTMVQYDVSTKDKTIQAIIAECKRQGLTLNSQIAYVLATVEHETNKTFEPVREAYWVKNAEEWRKNNLRYYPYYGRGYVQLTWDFNYKYYSELLGIDFESNPDAVMDGSTSVFILVHGFKHGIFTKKKITDYISKTKTNYVGARKCINGNDKAWKIAALAKEWVKKLDASKS